MSKLMVEGKDFFDGDTKLATKNIPSNAVDKVQVLKNYSEVGQLGGVTNNQDNIAINIKLKDGKKNFWFGNVTAGGGNSDANELYLAQPKLFYYSPEYSVNFIGDQLKLAAANLVLMSLALLFCNTKALISLLPRLKFVPLFRLGDLNPPEKL